MLAITIASIQGSSIDCKTIHRLDILYVDNWRITTTLPLTCDKLLTRKFPSNRISFDDPITVAGWQQTLNSLKLRPWNGKLTGDCRICCVLFDKSDSVISTVAVWPTGLKIDDSVFHFDSSCVNFLSKILPEGYFEALAENPESPKSDSMSKSTNLPPSVLKPSSLYTPIEGFVPDKITAVRIAEAVWLPLYGEDIFEKRPFKVELIKDSIWIVAGTLPKTWTVGGVPYIEIQKRDGRILAVGHGK